jgi:glycosyltransferase involved in cell wall biosynthesis
MEPLLEDVEIGIMPEMVDIEFFRLPTRPRKSNPFTFLSIGSLTSNKGIDLLLRSFAKIVETGANVKLEVGGDGPEEGRLHSLARDLRIQEHVRFLGELSREEVRSAMWRANTLTSTSYVETFGIVLIEAMATGIPVVATQSGGPCDTVRSEVGTLVPTGDVQALFEAMNHVRTSDFDETEIRSHVKRNYSTERVTDRLKSSYCAVVGNTSTG